ncbi:transient receptor potential cation channel protein painless-like [Lucilia cuprina]|uniref:transient receptor potential cation channel protein painless-like n=1 Tax=Lucilia cuprina TaxID=7375 RepID=UPI001F06303A|nr:transient receptor potential cation channel protein painless-like [Lucilia cuprina]
MENYYNIGAVTRFWAQSQIQLYEAFAERDIIKFRGALKHGANPLVKPPEQELCVLLQALKTPGCSAFVEACMRCSHKPTNLTDFYKKAINYACDLEDTEILFALYSSSDVKSRRKYFNLFALKSLAKKLNNQNAPDIQKRIRTVLLWGISENVPDHKEMTALDYVLENKHLNEDIKREIVKMFLSQCNIDIDTFRGGQLRRILENKYSDLILPRRISIFQSLMNRLIAGNMDVFKQQYNDNVQNINDNEKLQLLLESIKEEAHKAFDIILSKGVKYNEKANFSSTRLTGKSVQYNTLPQLFKMPALNFTPFQFACNAGNAYALEKLLQIPDIEIETNSLQQFIQLMIHRVKSSVALYQNYWDCFELLLDSPKIDINSVDQHKRTALHYAIEYQKDELIKALLRKGAYINVGKGEHELPLNSLMPSLLEEHLDDCISSNNLNMGEKEYEIKISFKNFITSQQKSEKKLKEVLTPIKCMAKSKEHCYLLQHPVISSILYLKWQKVSQIFYINLLLSLFYIASIITYIILNFQGYKHEMVLKITYICCWLGITYLIFRECVQFIVAPWKYVKKSLTNYLEILLIIFSILICYYNNRDLEVACILLLAFELLSLVGSLPIASISTHMLMLKAVCRSFAKSFIFYSIFLFTFTLCFYIKSEEHDQNQTVDPEDEFNRFSNPFLAFFKTIVMFIGEIDASNLNLNSSYSWLLFLSFIFFMTIILFNLLNGLAVSDTQAIRNQAELNGVICRIQLLSSFESVVLKRTKYLATLLKQQPFRFICKLSSHFVPDYATDIEVIFLPNDKNKICYSTAKTVKNLKMPDKDHNTTVILMENSEKLDSGGPKKSSATIDEHTSVEALKILKKKYAQHEKYPLHIMNEKLNILLQKFSLQN